MNKREVVWLIVRLIGLYLCYSAIIAAFTLASAIWAFIGLPSKPGAPGAETEISRQAENPPGISGFSPQGPNAQPENSRRQPQANRPADPAADEARRAVFKEVLWALLLTVIQSGIGFYLLIYGGLLFNILMRENQSALREKEPESILLNLTE